MEEKKCFISVPIINTLDYSKILQELKHQTDVRFSIVKPHNYHFTLHFFGSRNAQEIQSIETTLAEISFEPFIINLEEVAILPPITKKARVFIIKPIIGHQKFELLGKQIRQKLIDNGHPVDKRKFVPHLTVGRIKSKGNIEQLANLWLMNKLERHTQHKINQFVLMESIASPQGSIYKDIKSFHTVNQN